MTTGPLSLETPAGVSPVPPAGLPSPPIALGGGDTESGRVNVEEEEASDLTRPALDFYVFGRPAQQGSKSATIRGGRAVMFEDNKRTEPWRALVVSAARAAMPSGYDRIPKGVGVAVSITFTFDVPVSAPKRRRYWQTTRTSGDIDKLIRSTFDALTAAGVWHDDSQVVRLVEPFGKYNAGEVPEAMEIPGAHVRVYRIGGDE